MARVSYHDLARLEGGLLHHLNDQCAFPGQIKSLRHSEFLAFTDTAINLCLVDALQQDNRNHGAKT